jgi:hypothetical protein
MATPLTEEDALRRLSRMVAAEIEPRLDENELKDLLADARRYESWGAESSVGVGDKIAPTARNGRLYRCALAGTTGTTEPVWVSCGTTYYSGYLFTDGTARWEDAGPLPPQAWDLNAAAEAGWKRKAALASEMVTTGSGPDRLALEQVYDHCLKMAARFGPVFVS